MNSMSNPYEYYNGAIGVKVNFLTTDRNPNENSLRLLSYRALKKRMDTKRRPEIQLRRSCIGFDSLIAYDSLEQAWKDELTLNFGAPKVKAKQNFLASHYTLDVKALDFYRSFRYGEDNHLSLDKTVQEQYTINASLLNAILEVKAKRHAYKKALGSTTMNIWESLTADVEAIKEDIPHTIPVKSLRRKVTEYKKHGYESVISGKIQNQNARKIKEDEQKALLDELLAKHTNLDNTTICELYNIVAGKMGWKTITDSTVANRKGESSLVTHAGRNGIASLKNKVLMQNKRSKPSAPMLYWTLDGWDVELFYQKTERNDKGNAVTTYHNRLTTVFVLDAFNNYPIGFATGTHETPELIKEALLNAQNHVKELTGEHYRTFQLQSDNYGRGALTPMYQRITHNYTPAAVGNAKAKIIEPWFNRINKKYFKLFDNWSGFNITAGSKNQPNTEYLNKVKKNFPDEKGCRAQIESVIEQIRASLSQDFVTSFNENTNKELLSIMDTNTVLDVLGLTTGYTNTLQPAGLLPTINGENLCFDSFDINFRKLNKVDWIVKYNPEDLSKVLATDKTGRHQYMLEQKYIQPMALADRTENDGQQLKRINDFNNTTIDNVIEQRTFNARALDSLFQNDKLKDTLAKHLLTDSIGQHKNVKSKERLQVAQKAQVAAKKIENKDKKESSTAFAKAEQEYISSKVNMNDYLND